MRKKYVVERVMHDWLIKETTTEQYIYSFKKGDLARQTCNRLNGGGGFGGWTPSFILSPGLFFPDVTEKSAAANK